MKDFICFVIGVEFGLGYVVVCGFVWEGVIVVMVCDNKKWVCKVRVKLIEES